MKRRKVNAEEGKQGFQPVTRGYRPPTVGFVARSLGVGEPNADGADSGAGSGRVSWLRGMHDRYVRSRSTNATQKIGGILGFTVVSHDEHTGEWLDHNQGGTFARKLTTSQARLMHAAEELDAAAQHVDTAHNETARAQVELAQRLLKSATKPYSALRVRPVTDAERAESEKALLDVAGITRALRRAR